MEPARPVIAFDVASKTGIALGVPGGAPEAWSVDLGQRKSEDLRYGSALRLVRDLIRRHEPGLVAIEAPIGGRDANQILVGLVACIRGMAFIYDVPVKVCTVNSVRLHFLGHNPTAKDFPGMSKEPRRNAIKGLVLLRCQKLGWSVADHDAADAAAVWDYACSKVDPRHQAAPLGDLFTPGRRSA